MTRAADQNVRRPVDEVTWHESFCASDMTAAPSYVAPIDQQALAGRYLGPATVTQFGPALLEAELPGGERISPKLALAFPFEPALGDTLLVIGQGERYFVIGLIASTGQTSLHFRGNVELRAVSGTLELHGEEGVSLSGPQIDIKTKKLTVLAEKVNEAFGTVLTRVKSLMSVHTGATDTIVRGEWSSRSERAAITSQEVVSVNGKEVHLG